MIYHIATAADWARAQRDGQYTTSTRGRTLAEEGFIHACSAAQVAPVANAFYRGVPDLIVLIIDPDRVGPEIRYELVPGSDAPAERRGGRSGDGPGGCGGRTARGAWAVMWRTAAVLRTE